MPPENNLTPAQQRKLAAAAEKHRHNVLTLSFLVLVVAVVFGAYAWNSSKSEPAEITYEPVVEEIDSEYGVKPSYVPCTEEHLRLSLPCTPDPGLGHYRNEEYGFEFDYPLYFFTECPLISKGTISFFETCPDPERILLDGELSALTISFSEEADLVPTWTPVETTSIPHLAATLKTYEHTGFYQPLGTFSTVVIPRGDKFIHLNFSQTKYLDLVISTFRFLD